MAEKKTMPVLIELVESIQLSLNLKRLTFKADKIATCQDVVVSLTKVEFCCFKFPTAR